MEKIKNIFRRTFKTKKGIYTFDSRNGRAKLLKKIFKKYISGSIIDVGCSGGALKKYLSIDTKYVGVDIEGNADYIIDLEKERLDKFEDKYFDVVICTDVLEHLDNLHEIMDDLCRISKKYVIISLPNAWSNFKFSLIKGITDEKAHKFYGLPIEKPLDRHKWFFNYEQASNFLKKRGELNDFKVKYEFPVQFVQNSIRTYILNLFYKIYYKNKFGYKNLFYGSIWALFERVK